MDTAEGGRDSTAPVRLAVAVKRLHSRMREESGATSVGLPAAQLSIFVRLMKEGPATAASLAAAEHVSQQAIAQNLAGLKAGGLVGVTPDPNDGRKSLLSVTEAAHRRYESIMTSRDDWLSAALSSVIGPNEPAFLDQVITVLEQLAEVDLRPHRRSP